MKPILWAATALTAACLIGPAAAADAPAYLPAWAPALAPVYDWNGFYAGVHLGGAWQHRDTATIDPATSGVLATGAGDQSSFAGGGQFGVNFAMWPHFMVGMEADIVGALLHDTVVASNAAGTLQVQNDNNTNVFGTARGRAGYIWDNWLFYGTGGFAWSYTEITRTQQVGVIGGAGPGTVQSLFATPTGWVAGAGVEWAFAPQWTARLEYLHLDLGPTSFMFTSAGLRRDVEFTMDVFRVGLNYRFNLLSLGP